jgi:hypothetical protein
MNTPLRDQVSDLIEEIHPLLEGKDGRVVMDALMNLLASCISNYRTNIDDAREAVELVASSMTKALELHFTGGEVTRKPKLTYVERLLEKARKNPSPTVRDRRQTNLMDLVQQDRLKKAAFDNLDEIIRRKIEEGSK